PHEPFVAPIGDVYRAARVDAEAGGRAEGGPEPTGTRPAPGVCVPVRCEGLDAVSRRVCNQQPARGIHRESAGSGELPRTAGGDAKREQQVAGRRELLDAVVGGVGDERVAGRVARKRPWAAELSRFRAESAPAPREAQVRVQL